MIAVDSPTSILARFPKELAAQAPSLSHLRPSLRGADPEDVDIARFAWASRIVDEYRSVVVFSELLTLLARLEMPYAALCAVQRLIGDELRHTRICAEVVEWLGGMKNLDVDLSDLALPPTDHTMAGRALAIVARELTVAEAESVRVLRAYRDATTDPAIRAVLAQLLKDEARHAAVGPYLEAVLVEHLPPEAFGGLLAELEAIKDEDRRDLRALYEEVAAGGPGRALGASITAADLGNPALRDCRPQSGFAWLRPAAPSRGLVALPPSCRDMSP